MQPAPDSPSFRIDLETQQSGRRRSFRQRRRNRHGRGLRGELSYHLPGHRSRAERFDDLVLEAAERLHDAQGPQLDGVLFAVEEIPPGLEELLLRHEPPPLGQHSPAVGEEAPKVTVYRRVVEQNSPTPEDLPHLVRAVVVEHTAQLLGVDPETLDPGHGQWPGDS